MTVGDVISYCEYTNCKVLKATGEEIYINDVTHSRLYGYSVEHLSAKDNDILIWTFVDFDKLM